MKIDDVVVTPRHKGRSEYIPKPVKRAASIRRMDPFVITKYDWKDIPSLPDYAICEKGYVMSKARYSRESDDRAPKWLEKSLIKLTLSGNYLKVKVRVDGKPKVVLLHRIMAEVFLGPCPDNHKLWVGKDFKYDHHIRHLKYVPLKVKRRIKCDLPLPLQSADSPSSASPSGS